MSHQSNPVENIINSKARTIRISSNERVTGTNGRFTIDLASSGGIIDNVRAFIVKWIECPNVFDNIPTYANVIQLVKSTGPVTYNITIPNGYYFLNDLITQLNTSINAVIADTVAVTTTGTYPNEKINFDFTGDDYTIVYANSTIYNKIGLSADLVALDGVPTDVQLIPNLVGETSVYVHSRTLAPSNLVEAQGSFSVVDKVNMDKPYTATCYTDFNNDTTHMVKYYPYESLKSLRTISITLRNAEGELLVLPENFVFRMGIRIFYN